MNRSYRIPVVIALLVVIAAVVLYILARDLDRLGREEARDPGVFVNPVADLEVGDWVEYRREGGVVERQEVVAASHCTYRLRVTQIPPGGAEQEPSFQDRTKWDLGLGTRLKFRSMRREEIEVAGRTWKTWRVELESPLVGKATGWISEEMPHGMLRRELVLRARAGAKELNFEYLRHGHVEPGEAPGDGSDDRTNRSDTTAMKYCLPSRFLAAAERHPDRPALSWREGEQRHSLTYAALAERVRSLASGLRKRGIKAGDRILLLADNSPRWITADMATLYLGAIDVPRGSDTLPEELDYMIRHAEARAAIVGNPKLLEALGEHRASLDLIVLLEGVAEGAETLEGLIAEGGEEDIGPPVPGADDVATIVYTSGTTGLPKGVPLTHGNILHNVRTLPDIVALDEKDRFLSLLPAWHVYERTVEYIILAMGAELVYTIRRRLKEDMASEQPTFLAAVPRVFEAIYTGADRKFRAASAPRRALATFLLGQSRSLSEKRLTRLTKRLLDPEASRMKRFGWWLRWFVTSLPNRPFHGLGKLLVYRKILRATGGKLRGAISGGGALPRHVEGFFDTVGLPILVGYGLTETSPVVACRRPERNIRGTIGQTLPETEVQVRSREGKPVAKGEEGVLWFRGPQVFDGYYRDPELSAKVLDRNGWFDTGDLGRILPWGDIVFTGRAKETIVLSSGENVEPEPLELALLASRLILQVLVLGQDKKHLGAIVVPDVPALTEILGEEPRLNPGGRAEGAIRNEVNRILGHRKGIRPSERIHAIRLVNEEFKVEDGTLTPTLKMRRDRIEKRHHEEVEALFLET